MRGARKLAGPVADAATTAAIRAAESGLVPDPVLRSAVRRFCRNRLRSAGSEDPERSLLGWERRLRRGPIAPRPDLANRQHYEVPTEFFRKVLGPRLKYSCCYWPSGTAGLAEAENAALDLYCRRAGVADGMEILDLGCGWGSLALYLAERFPGSRITAVSNSATQKAWIDRRSGELGLGNVTVRTADVNDFEPGRRFDRVLSIEMFEHLRNYQELLARIRRWLAPDGLLFVHVFGHRRLAYGFRAAGAGDWVARHFFSGGLMPAYDLLPRFSDDFELESRWWWPGRHYQLTAEAWLARLDSDRAEVRRTLSSAYGADEAGRWLRRWRLFFIACAEQWGYAGGSEWGVGNYLLAPRPRGD